MRSVPRRRDQGPVTRPGVALVVALAVLIAAPAAARPSVGAPERGGVAAPAAVGLGRA
jgi:hypothetical protein